MMEEKEASLQGYHFDCIPRARSLLREKANEASKKKCNTLICVLENPKNMQNIGAVIRTAHCLGVGKLYIIEESKIPQRTKDDLNVVRPWREHLRHNSSLMNSSSSAIKWTYLRKFSSSQECLEYLKKKNYTSIVTSPHIKGKNNVLLSDGNYTDKKLAVWFGNETVGISNLVVNAADRCIQIPMCGIVESFNLAVSAGIVLYEITQQRRLFIEKK